MQRSILRLTKYLLISIAPAANDVAYIGKEIPLQHIGTGSTITLTACGWGENKEQIPCKMNETQFPEQHSSHAAAVPLGKNRFACVFPTHDSVTEINHLKTSID